jgi:VanZ family protein
MPGSKPTAQALQPPEAAWWVRWLFWALVGITLVLSLLPVEQLPREVHFWDKAQHALGFAGLSFLGLRVGASRPRLTLVALALLGLGIEWAQSLTGWRQGDWQDWLADLVGLAMGWQALRLVQHLAPRWRLRQR